MNTISKTDLQMSLIKTSSAPSQLTPAQQRLAEELRLRHGNVRVSRESHGLHFAIACPVCLQNNGESELLMSKMHLSINVDKYIRGHNGAAMCMKCSTRYRIDELTFWAPLEKRGYHRGPPKIIDIPFTPGEFHECDEKGNWVPKGPGETVALRSLPDDHPAIAYLRFRKFEIGPLVHQFNVQYCVKERTDIRFRRLLNGFRATPQNRLIFGIYHQGIRLGWQGRVIDWTDDNYHYYLHPYRQEWTAFESRETPNHPWVALPEWEDFECPKYITAHGTRRNAVLMGFDGAKAFNAATPPAQRWAMVTEGPLDAGRLGPPAVATLGKFLSEAQADLLLKTFQTLIFVPDNDSYGSKLIDGANQWIGSKRRFFVIHPPRHLKDVGDLAPSEVESFRLDAMARAGLA